MWDNEFIINEIRAFSVPNLLEGATVIESPPPKDTSYSVNNLIENQEARSSRNIENAITDWAGNTVTRST